MPLNISMLRSCQPLQLKIMQAGDGAARQASRHSRPSWSNPAYACLLPPPPLNSCCTEGRPLGPCGWWGVGWRTDCPHGHAAAVTLSRRTVLSSAHACSPHFKSTSSCCSPPPSLLACCYPPSLRLSLCPSLSPFKLLSSPCSLLPPRRPHQGAQMSANGADDIEASGTAQSRHCGTLVVKRRDASEAVSDSPCLRVSGSLSLSLSPCPRVSPCLIAPCHTLTHLRVSQCTQRHDFRPVIDDATKMFLLDEPSMAGYKHCE